MAIINSIVIGKARKSIGNVTLSTIEGRTIAREKPAYVRDPKTSKQVVQRNKMRMLVGMFQQNGRQFSRLWTSRKKYNSPYNAFVSANMVYADSITYDDNTGLYKSSVKLLYGRGVFDSTSLSVAKGVDDETEVSFNNVNMIGQLKDGDIIGVFAAGADGTISWHEQEILTSSIITIIETSGKRIFEERADPTDTLYCYYLSGDGRVSCVSH